MTCTRAHAFSGLRFLALASILAFVACSRGEAKTRGVGDGLKAFIVKSCETGEQYCQICNYGGKPTIMAIADIEDPSVDQTLLRLQKLIDDKAKDGLVGFAVLAHVRDGKLLVVPDEAKAIAILNERRLRLGLRMPLVTLPAKLTDHDRKNYALFNDAYELKGAPEVLFANAGNKIVYAGVLDRANTERELKSLEDAVAKSL